jgi:hypothetical protein
MARPKKAKYQLKNLCKIIDEYTNVTSIPILKEVCYQNDLNYSYVMQMRTKEENVELSNSIKRLLDKKEAQLERLGLTGKIDRGMAIFSLKQLGWKDKPEQEDSIESIAQGMNTLTKAMLNNVAPNRKIEDFE